MCFSEEGMGLRGRRPTWEKGQSEAAGRPRFGSARISNCTEFVTLLYFY